MSELTAYQDAFAAALLADEPMADAAPEVASLVAQPGFAVYRNTVTKGCIDALQANYPTVARLAGEEWFRAAAAVFARKQLPPRASLLFYGESFPAFLDGFEPAGEIPYLASVARVDRWWTEAHAAADASPLDAESLAALSAAAMSTHSLVVHPATRWGWSDHWPIHRLWALNRHDADAGGAIEWVGEGVLVTREVGPVAVEALDRGGAALLDATADGRTIEAAVVAAMQAQPGIDVALLIHQLLRAGAFCGVRCLTPEGRR